MNEPGMVAARPRSALRIRDFRVFWIGALLSNSGTWLQSLTVPYVLFELTSSALWVGLAAVAQFLPMVILSPVGGTLADRYSRRTILVLSQSAMALIAALLCLAWVGGLRQPALLLALVAFSGAVNGINMPSWQAFVSDLVPREYLMSAVTLNSVQFNAARAVGPAIAGVVLATLGAGWAFGLNVLSFGAVLIALLLLRVRPTPSAAPSADGPWRQFRDAMGYTRKEPLLLLIISISGVVGGLGNPVFGFTVVFAGIVYFVGPAALGLLNVAPGVGAVLAAGWLTRRVGGDVLSRGVRIGLPMYGIAIMVFAAWPSYVVGLIALVVVGAAFLTVISSINTSLQLHVEERYRGRVMALRLMAFTLSVSIGGAVQGWLADRIGPRVTVFMAGAVILLIALVLRHLRGRFSLLSLDQPQARVLSE